MGGKCLHQNIFRGKNVLLRQKLSGVGVGNVRGEIIVRLPISSYRYLHIKII